MITTATEHHGFTLRADGRPLRTKVVATIGDPERYPDGIVDLEGVEIAARELDYRRLTEAFRRHGADVIRLNLSHIPDPGRARQVLRSIKRAILDSEHRDPQLKKIAILADLPGPKIRFDIEPELALAVGDRLGIAFDGDGSAAGTQAVFVDGSPLMTAMNRIDDIRAQLGSYRQEPQFEDPSPDRGEIADNILGYSMEPSPAGQRLFERLMERISQRIASGDRLLVFIGEAEVVLEVDGSAFDRRRPLLP